MFRKVKIALFITWIGALSGPVFGIGLGEIQLGTPLNEPLHAEIQLLNVKDLGEGDLLVGLAPKADFEAAGVERLFFLTSLKFSLDLDNARGPVIVVSTDAPVREPYLNFLLEVQWPNGRLLREYTLLMDLPTFAETQSVARAIKGTETAAVPAVQATAPATQMAAVDVAALEAELAAVEQAPVAPAPPVAAPAADAMITEQQVAPAADTQTAGATAQEPAYEAQPEQAPSVAEAAEPAATAEQAPAAVADYQPVVPVYAASMEDYSVVAGDNLWIIAAKYRQQTSECVSREYACADGTTMQQAMLAMQRLNPDAFINGNINQLKKGRVLRMPTRDDVSDITSREAVAEVMRQNIAWSGDANGRRGAVVASEQLDATVAGAPSIESTETLEDGRLKLTVPGAADGSQAGKGSGADSGKIEALQNELVIAMEELDRIKREKTTANDQIGSLGDQVKTLEKMLQVRSAELQALQAAAEKAAAEQPAAAPAAEVPAAEAVPAMETPPAAEEAPVAAEPPATEKPAAEVAPAAEPGLSDMLMANLMYIVGAIGALLVVVLAVVVVRKRAAYKSNVIEDDEPTRGFATRGASDLRDDEGSLDDLDEVVDSLEDTLDDMDMDAPEETELAAAPAKAETGDALSEADIYISFGSYDKAESLLKNAVSAEPKRTDLRLKLLEVYVGMDNLASFDKQYEALSGLQNAGATERAREMRARISGADLSPLAGEPVEKGDAGISDFGDMDLDLSLDTDDTDNNPKLDFDLDLSLDLDEEPSLSDVPTGSSPKVNVSDAPTVQQRALNVNDMPTAISPAVKAAQEKTEIREELDLDWSALDDEPEVKTGKSFSADVKKAIANDEPTPATGLDEEFDFLADADEAATKLDLARAYIDMGDKDGAKDILQEVLEEGNPTQKDEARKLLDSIG